MIDRCHYRFLGFKDRVLIMQNIISTIFNGTLLNFLTVTHLFTDNLYVFSTFKWMVVWFKSNCGQVQKSYQQQVAPNQGGDTIQILWLVPNLTGRLRWRARASEPGVGLCILILWFVLRINFTFMSSNTALQCIEEYRYMSFVLLFQVG